ncbi:MAG: YafY family transcriptional regulator [Candidatus Azobacteroides sp.]|nr:YafY family transcriptional regulator [Candidatus Azobacteroides sp.]
MNKIERLSAILIKLQSRKYITAQQIAQQFGISLRTVYRDLRILEESGVPLTAVPGTGYALVDGYKLPPLMFTASEAIAFLMAEKVLSQQADPDSYAIYRSGMDKIRAVLKATEKDVLENIEENIRVVDKFSGTPEYKPENILSLLLHGIAGKETVIIKYTANYNQKVTCRAIEPLGFSFMSNQWYVVAWCKLKKDYRIFKLSRIRKITSEGNAFHRIHPPSKVLLERFYTRDVIHTIRISVTRSACQDMGFSKFTHGLTQEEEGEEGAVIQTYRIFSLEFFARWYLSFADKATILEPEELKETVRELLLKIRI